MISMRNSNCRPQNKQTFTNCLLQSRGNRGQPKRQQSQRSDYCSVRYNCYQQTRYTQACYDRSAAVRSELCRCTRQAQVSAYKSLYVSCLRSAGYPVANEQQDYNLVALNAMSNTGGDKKFCSNATDPCGGFQGRQTVRRGNGGGNRGSNQGWNTGGNSQGWNSGSSGTR
uniref:Uncharacterized protein n=1 Tax=Romanomermis culicivorax TaxID=13658 RepID=A0A915KHB1_ROMCU